MADLLDYELRPDEDALPYAPPRRRVPGPWLVAVLLVVVAIVAAYFIWGRRSAVQPVATTDAASAVAATEEPVSPLGRDAAEIDVPPLDETDPLVRQLVQALSSHPRIAAWLATEGLIRQFTVVAHSIEDGRSPVGQLKVLRPSFPLGLTERRDGLYLDALSYTRYNAFADAVASVDPPGAARTYATLKPRIEEAHRELGFPDVPFDRTLERAIVLLLKTPVVDEPIRLEPLRHGIGYGFADPRLEALNGAQKQLVRMGPRNMRLVQDQLRQIALSLGIPQERLPAAR